MPLKKPRLGLENSSAHVNCDVHVWDTQYYPASKAFNIFRDGICSTFMPWSPEFNSDDDFGARIEGIAFGEGSIGRVRMSPLVTTRTKTNIASSSVDGYYANFVLSGELKVEQSGRLQYREGPVISSFTILRCRSRRPAGPIPSTKTCRS